VDEVSTTTDVAAIRALTHPLRLQLLDLLRFEGPSTATLLGRRVGESSGSTSYHLRQLARHGFIEEATDQPSGRERWWRHRERIVRLPPAGSESGAERAAAAAMYAEILASEAHALDRYLALRPRHPEWSGASYLERRAVRLTPDELKAFGDRVHDLLAELRPARADDAPAEAGAVRVLFLGIPFLEEDQ
jgi:DNA-binding transcriptional ArsR family regulator